MHRPVVVVDAEGRSIGEIDLWSAHAGAGILHRAFSVYLFAAGRQWLLIQQRSAEKRLFAGYWANSCCSHPWPGEELVAAGQRRLQEECGLACKLSEAGWLVYQAADPRGQGSEHEHVTLLVGDLPERQTPQIDPREIAAWQWISLADLWELKRQAQMSLAPWFILGLERLGQLGQIDWPPRGSCCDS